MLRSLKSLERYKLCASDGEIGSVADFLIDDHRWAVRYLVAETASFFADRKVLISPLFFRQADWAERRFHLAMTRDKIKNSPAIGGSERRC